MLLIAGQDRSQVRLVQDQGPVQDLTAQGANKALADRVHPRRLHLCVPKISSTSCDQVILVNQATDLSVLSDAVPVEVDGVG
jgi:hypothetical protein